MEDLIFFILCFLSTINISIKCLNNFYLDYMNLNNTNSIKGIFVWIIFLQHYRSYYRRDPKYIYHLILNCTQQKMVSLFLFYSGFGIYESIKKKHINYVKNLPKKGLFLFIKYQISLLIFLLNNLLLGIKINFKNYLLSMILKTGIGNSFWFSLTIISFYIYSYISFIFIKNNNFIIIGFLLINIISLLHIYLVYNYYHPKSFCSVDNILCFNIGLYYSLFKNYLDKIIMKNDANYYGFFLFNIIIYTYYYNYKIKFLWTVSIINALFSLIIILITMKIRFNNEFLILLNSHSYSIYLLQRAIMKFFKNYNYFSSNNFIRFFIEFITIIFISSVFDKNTDFIYKFIINYKSKKKELINIFNDENIKLVLINRNKK